MNTPSLSTTQVVNSRPYRREHWRYLLTSKILQATGQSKPAIRDEMWYQLQFRPKEALKFYGIPVPGLPPDEVQLRFTGNTGQQNLQQAFSFYLYICSVCNLKEMKSPKILDF